MVGIGWRRVSAILAGQEEVWQEQEQEQELLGQVLELECLEQEEQQGEEEQ